MSKRYASGVVSSTSPTVNAAGASGVFTLNQQSAAQSTNNWPPYKVEKSLRFRRSASGYLSRTPASASNRRIWTWSGWVKLGLLSVARQIFGTTGNANQSALVFEAGDTLFAFSENASQTFLRTTQVFRDPSAWYHVVWSEDTTQATSSNRSKLYVNGVQITAFSTANYPSQNFQGTINNNATHYISSYDGSNWLHDGYLAEVNFIDGQQLTPSYFGATDKDGNWSPIAYTGSYGTNGFYLNFKDATSTSTVGYDYSGNGNNWASSGISVTAGTTYDSMIDVPSDQSDGTANNRGNYATFNPLEKGSNVTLSEGNLKYSTSSASGVNGIVSMRISTGMKSYFEFTCGSVSLYRNISIGGMTYAGDSGSISGGTGGTGTFATWTTGDIIRFACDYNAGTIACYKNATLQTTVTGITNTSDWAINAAQSTNTTGEYTANFGQRPFAYEPPSGFKTLNTFNLPEPTIKQPNKYFDVVTYTGDGNSTKSITGVNFQPGFAWVKSRSNAQINVLGDVLRGMPNRTLRSDSTDEEQTFGGGNIQSLDSNGITVSYGSVGLNTNESGYTYVAWQWNAGNANTTNTSGTITSIVRANQTAGFSVVTYTGTGGTGTTTVGHGLTVSPSMVLIKRRDSAASWATYHTGLTSTSYYLFLNSTAGQANYGSTFISPSSSTLTIAADSSLLNTSTGTYVAYCFAPVAGYSAFGSYTGNGSSDGPFIYTGFRPRYVLVKRTDTIANWTIRDTARNPYNSANLGLFPNLSAAEDSTSGRDIDILSNGFKIRGTDSDLNTSSGTYIYMAFAETPFKYSRSR